VSRQSFAQRAGKPPLRLHARSRRSTGPFALIAPYNLV